MPLVESVAAGSVLQRQMRALYWESAPMNRKERKQTWAEGKAKSWCRQSKAWTHTSRRSPAYTGAVWFQDEIVCVCGGGWMGALYPLASINCWMGMPLGEGTAPLRQTFQALTAGGCVLNSGAQVLPPSQTWVMPPHVHCDPCPEPLLHASLGSTFFRTWEGLSSLGKKRKRMVGLMNQSPWHDCGSQGYNRHWPSFVFHSPLETALPFPPSSAALGGLPDGITNTLIPERPKPPITMHFSGHDLSVCHQSWAREGQRAPKWTTWMPTLFLYFMCNSSPTSSPWWPGPTVPWERWLNFLLVGPGGSSSL